jgi:hypothetical protein
MTDDENVFIVPKDYVFRPLGWRESSFVADGKTYYMSFNCVQVKDNEPPKEVIDDEQSR